jgi:hypothetical protein
MNCPKCNAFLGDAKYCSKCGFLARPARRGAIFVAIFATIVIGVGILIFLSSVVPTAATRDDRTEILAYAKASEQFRDSYYAQHQRYPNTGPYSPARVVEEAPGIFKITVLYEGRDRNGEPEPHASVPITIRCADGLCY